MTKKLGRPRKMGAFIYRLPVRVTRKQKAHLDEMTIVYGTASIYVRSLIDADMARNAPNLANNSSTPTSPNF